MTFRLDEFAPGACVSAGSVDDIWCVGVVLGPRKTVQGRTEILVQWEFGRGPVIGYPPGHRLEKVYIQ